MRDRRRELLLGDLDPDDPRAEPGELAHQPAAPAADVDHILSRRTDEALEYGQIVVHVAGQGASELKASCSSVITLDEPAFGAPAVAAGDGAVAHGGARRTPHRTPPSGLICGGAAMRWMVQRPS